MKLQIQTEHKMSLRFIPFMSILLLSGMLYAADVKSEKSFSNSSGKKTEDVVFAEKIKSSLNSQSIEETLSLFENMPSSLQSNTDMLILKASVMLSANKLKEAAQVVEQLKIAEPDNRDVMELSLFVTKISGNRSKLLSEIDQILQKEPNNDFANIEKAELYLSTNSYAEASECYIKAMMGNPKNLDAIFGLGRCYYYLKRQDLAKKYLIQVIENNEKDSQANLYMGKISAEENRFRAALKYVQKAAENDPENYDIFIDMGTYCRHVMDFKGAEEAWTKAIELAPDFFLSYAYRASLYEEMEEFAKAYEDYKKVIALNPKYFYAFVAMGMVAWHEQDYPGAYECFQKAYEMNSGDLSYPMMMACCLMKVGRIPQMKAFLQTYMKKLDRASVEYSIARLFHDGGGANAENSTFLKVKREQSNTKRGKLLYYMGIFYEMNNFQERADDFYKQVTEINTPVFFEYKLAEWSLKNGKSN